MKQFIADTLNQPKKMTCSLLKTKSVAFCLSLFGYPPQSNKTALQKMKMMLKPFSLYVDFVFVFNCILATASAFSKTSATIILCNSCSFLLWHSLQLRNEELHRLVKLFGRVTVRAERHRLFTTLTTGGLFITFLLPLIFSIAVPLAHYKPEETKYNRFFLFGNILPEDRTLEAICMFLSGTVYYSPFLVPCIVTVIFTTLCKTLTEILSHEQRVILSEIHMRKEMLRYHQFVVYYHNLEEVFSTPILLTLAYFFGSIFNALSLSLGYGDTPRCIAVVETILTVTVCSVCSICLIFSASNVPERILRKKMLHKMAFSLQFSNYTSEKNKDNYCLDACKTLSELEPLYLTICKAMTINKSLMFTLFGCSLTYGILILQINNW